MEFRQLGLTDHKISRLGFGCAPMGGYDYGKVNDRDSINAVRKALDLGVNFFDTADVYGFGHAEEILGSALGDERNKVIIATKFGLKWDKNGKVASDCSAKRVITALEDSLKRLKVDTITIYQIHWPNPETPIQETMEALVKCQKEGKIKHIGCSNFGKDLIENFQSYGLMESLESSYNLLDRSIEKNILSYCQESNMTFFAHSALARGFLTGKYSKGHHFVGSDTRNVSHYFSDNKNNEKQRLLNAMKEIARRYGKTVSQVAIRWVLDNPLVTSAIVGIKNINQLEGNIGSMDWRLSSDDVHNLSDLSQYFVNESSD